MIKVIPLFSFLNGDFDTENLRIIPYISAVNSDSLNFGYTPFPFLMAFTDEKL